MLARVSFYTKYQGSRHSGTRGKDLFFYVSPILAYVKHATHGVCPFLATGQKSNSLGRSSIDHATYQISRLYAVSEPNIFMFSLYKPMK